MAYKVKDEQLARDANIEIPVKVMVELSNDDFEALLTSARLLPDQIVLCKKIRRRGKNKVAALRCRQKQADFISNLEFKLETAKADLCITDQVLSQWMLEEEKLVVELNELLNSILIRKNYDPNLMSVCSIDGKICFQPRIGGLEPFGSLRPCF